jgi:hypothetical protein
MVGKILSVKNGPERNVRLSISPAELCSEISSPPGMYQPQSVDHYEICGLQQHEHGLVTITLVMKDNRRVLFYSTYEKLDMALLLDQLDATIGYRHRESAGADALEYPNRYVSILLTGRQVLGFMEALQPVLQELVGNTPLIARYGFGCAVQSDQHGAPMQIGTDGVRHFIRDSVQQKIITPGESDIHFELPPGRLQIVFCHEGHVHVGGTELELGEQFVTSKPFDSLFFGAAS